MGGVADQVGAVGQNLVAVGLTGLGPDPVLALWGHYRDHLLVGEVDVPLVIDHHPFGIVVGTDDLHRLDSLRFREHRCFSGRSNPGIRLSGGTTAQAPTPEDQQGAEPKPGRALSVHGNLLSCYSTGLDHGRRVLSAWQTPWPRQDSVTSRLTYSCAPPSKTRECRNGKRCSPVEYRRRIRGTRGHELGSRTLAADASSRRTLRVRLIYLTKPPHCIDL